MAAIHPLVVLTGISGAALLALLRAIIRRADQPGATSLAGIVGGAALWSLAYTVALSTFDPALREALELLIWTGRMAMPIAWVTFALAYAGRSDLVTRGTVLAISLPHLVMLGLIALNPGNVVWSDYRIVGTSLATVQYDYGLAFIVDSLYSYMLIAVGSVLLVGAALTSPQRYDDQVASLLVGAAVPTIASFVWLFGYSPVPGMDFTPISLVVTGLTFSYALFRAEVLTATPGVRRASVRAALDDFSQAVVLVDDGGRLLNTNENARTMLDLDESSAWTANIHDLLDAEPGAFEPGTHRVVLDTHSGRRVFDLVVSGVTDPLNRDVGYNFVFHDVTEREQRKQRLAVLNRVLRHNLRNDINVIAGSAASIRDANGPRSDALLSNILDRADRLATLGEQAKEAQRVVERREETTRTVDLEAFLEHIISQAADREPDVEFSCSLPADVSVHTDLAILELVVWNALENALMRADRTTARIEVTAETWAGDRWVDIELTDNGSGISDQDRVAIDGDEESALEHASALDLWLVRWGMNTLGGDVTLSDGDGRQSTLHLHLPRRVKSESVTVDESV